MAYHASKLNSLKLLGIIMLSGCATATFYSRGNAENATLPDNPSPEVKLVSAEMEGAEAGNPYATETNADSAGLALDSPQPAGSDNQAAEVKSVDSAEEKSFFACLTKNGFRWGKTFIGQNRIKQNLGNIIHFVSHKIEKFLLVHYKDKRIA